MHTQATGAKRCLARCSWGGTTCCPSSAPTAAGTAPGVCASPTAPGSASRPSPRRPPAQSPSRYNRIPWQWRMWLCRKLRRCQGGFVAVRMAVALFMLCCCSQHPPVGKAYAACHVLQTLVAFCTLHIAGHRQGMRLLAGGAAPGRRLGGELPVLPGQGDPCNRIAQSPAHCLLRMGMQQCPGTRIMGWHLYGM